MPTNPPKSAHQSFSDWLSRHGQTTETLWAMQNMLSSCLGEHSLTIAVREEWEKSREQKPDAPEVTVVSGDFCGCSRGKELYEPCEKCRKPDASAREAAALQEHLTELLDRISPKGGKPLNRGQAIVELAMYLIELFPPKP